MATGTLQIPMPASFVRRPIGPHATKLVQTWMQRDAFWRAVDTLDLPVEIAGEVHLSVGKRQAYHVHVELEAAGGPARWFRAEARGLIERGKVLRGGMVKSCPVADVFFSLLADETDEALERTVLEYTLINAKEKGATYHD